jgi:hypothetical protein
MINESKTPTILRTTNDGPVSSVRAYETLKVGDEVAIVDHGSSFGRTRVTRFAKVTKINRHGHVSLEGTDRQFDRFLRERSVKGSYAPRTTTLWDATVARQYAEDRGALRARASDLRAMSEEFKGLINGYGEASQIDEATKNAWIECIRAL